MCLEIPGKIIKIEKDIATIDYGTEQRQAKIIQGNFKIGDYVLVKAKIVTEKLPKQQIKNWLSLLKEDGA